MRLIAGETMSEELRNYVDDYCYRMERLLHDHFNALYELGRITVKEENNE